MRDVGLVSRVCVAAGLVLALGCGSSGADADADADGKGDCADGDGACDGASGLGYVADVKPILTASCTSCHSGAAPAAGLNLNQMAGVQSVVSACDCQGSLLFQKLGENPPFGARMPLGGPFLSTGERAVICQWIDEGAESTFDPAACESGGEPDAGTGPTCGDGTCDAGETCDDCADDCGECPTSGCVEPAPGDEVDFPAVKNIIDAECVGCHGGAGFSAGGLDLTTYAGVASRVTACDCEDSLLFQKIGPTPPFGARMPKNAPPLSASKIDQICRWIDQGAEDQGD
jgi:hypothetical protein